MLAAFKLMKTTKIGDNAIDYARNSSENVKLCWQLGHCVDPMSKLQPINTHKLFTTLSKGMISLTNVIELALVYLAITKDYFIRIP